VEQLKRLARQLGLPLARALVARGVSANALTVLGFLLNVGVAVLLAHGWLLLGGALLLLVNALDFLDGTVARLSGTAGPLGAFLDSVLDRYSEAVVYVGLAFWFGAQGQPLLAVLAMAALVGSFMVSYTRARAEGLGYHGEVGWAPRPERIVALGGGLVLQALLPALPVLPAVLALITLLTNWTAYQRARHVAEQVGRQAK
jgi:CDP-diacylglycerol--glycerol-3-phosphate 3-phosphatidyltransferase